MQRLWKTLKSIKVNRYFSTTTKYFLRTLHKNHHHFQPVIFFKTSLCKTTFICIVTLKTNEPTATIYQLNILHFLFLCNVDYTQKTVLLLCVQLAVTLRLLSPLLANESKTLIFSWRPYVNQLFKAKEKVFPVKIFHFFCAVFCYIACCLLRIESVTLLFWYFFVYCSGTLEH